jgi:hypothetical protein
MEALTGGASHPFWQPIEGEAGDKASMSGSFVMLAATDQ